MLEDGFREGDYVFERSRGDFDEQPKPDPMGYLDKFDSIFDGIWRYRPEENATPSQDVLREWHGGSMEDIGATPKKVDIHHDIHGLVEGVERNGLNWRKGGALYLTSEGWDECIVGEEVFPDKAFRAKQEEEAESHYRAIRVLAIEGSKAFVRETLKRSVIDAETPTTFIEQGGTISYRSTKIEKVVEIEEAELGE